MVVVVRRRGAEWSDREVLVWKAVATKCLVLEGVDGGIRRRGVCDDVMMRVLVFCVVTM